MGKDRANKPASKGGRKGNGGNGAQEGSEQASNAAQSPVDLPHHLCAASAYRVPRKINTNQTGVLHREQTRDGLATIHRYPILR
jgi:hypothetical protein